jgi:hypothetical protein
MYASFVCRFVGHVAVAVNDHDHVHDHVNDHGGE